MDDGDLSSWTRTAKGHSARGREHSTLTDVYLAPRPIKNIVSYGTLAEKGFALVYDGVKRALARRRDGAIVRRGNI